MKLLFAVFPLLIASCAGVAPSLPDGTNVALGQKALVDGPLIMPVEILEDSRCPANARCVWAGQVKISAVWVRPAGNQRIELTSGKPLSLADGKLTLTDVRPTKMTGRIIEPKDYRFTLTFEGGL